MATELLNGGGPEELKELLLKLDLVVGVREIRKVGTQVKQGEAFMMINYGDESNLEERLHGMQEVDGSIPFGSTIVSCRGCLQGLNVVGKRFCGRLVTRSNSSTERMPA